MTIEGRSTTLIALSDFVGNLAGSGCCRSRSRSSTARSQPATGTGAQATPELIQFTVRAQINTPPQAAAAGRSWARGRGQRGREPRAKAGPDVPDIQKWQ